MMNEGAGENNEDDDEPMHPLPAVEAVVGLVMGVDPALINEDSAVNEVENWDSFQHQVLLQVLEQTYDVKFTEAADISNVRDMKELIVRNRP